jgi:hypothetical protein
MMQLPEQWRQFEDLVQRILEARGFSVTPHSPRGDAGYDFTGFLKNQRWAIEVKYYRTDRAQPHLIEAAARRVAQFREQASSYRGMLIVSCTLPAEMRAAFELKFSILFVDRVDLKMWTAGSPLLSEELDVLMGASIKAKEEVAVSRDDPLERVPSEPPIDLEFVSPLPPTDVRGSELCADLKLIKPGKVAWPHYEAFCAQALKYLFPNDLEGWHKQKRTDDGLNRFDFVCRLRPTTEFWNFLIDHLNSRYVLFEFKNYTDKIAQGQILTTEKYLLERALRRVALIFTRKGPDDDAIKMTQGAMREHGKLMLVIDDDKLCKMLHLKERGEDPSDYLFNLADDFLLSLPR